MNCFKPISKGIRSETIQRFNDNTSSFEISMINAPFSHQCPCCCISSFPLTMPCVQMHMRYKVLNHIHPRSGWDNYICCQGYIPACGIFTPNFCCDKEFPRTCMFLETCIFPGLAISSTRYLFMEFYNIYPDPCDNRMVVFNNFLQLMSCVCSLTSNMNRKIGNCSIIFECISECCFISLVGCMTAQLQQELLFREVYLSLADDPYFLHHDNFSQDITPDKNNSDDGSGNGF